MPLTSRADQPADRADEGGQTLVIWYDTEDKESDVDGAAAFFLRCRIPDNGRMRVEELPSVTVAAVIERVPPKQSHYNDLALQGTD